MSKITRRGLLRWMGVAGAVAALPAIGGPLGHEQRRDVLEGIFKIRTEPLKGCRTYAEKMALLHAELSTFEHEMRQEWLKIHEHIRPVKAYSTCRLVPAGGDGTPESYEVYIRYRRPA